MVSFDSTVDVILLTAATVVSIAKQHETRLVIFFPLKNLLISAGVSIMYSDSKLYLFVVIKMRDLTNPLIYYCTNKNINYSPHFLTR